MNVFPSWLVCVKMGMRLIWVGVAMLVLALLLVPMAAAAQQHSEKPGVTVAVPASALEKRMQRELVCICGTCGHKSLAECTCGTAAQMRAQLSEQVKLGKSEEEIQQYFIATYGSQEPLGAPIDRGFNRLAWLLPYVVGGTCLIAIGVIAVRWSRHDRGEAPSALTDVDEQLEARLDDELRNLD